MRKKTYGILATLLTAAVIAGCVSPSAKAAGNTMTQTEEYSITAENLESFSVSETSSSGTEANVDAIRVVLSDSGCTAEDDSVVIEGSVITITEEGEYRLSGTLSNGQIVIRASEESKVKLILDGVDITSEGSAAIYAVSADKLVIELAEGSGNLLRSVGDYVQTDENNVDAVVFAKCDLTIKGEGSLGVSSETGHGIVSKDDLKINGGTISVQSAEQGISGNDSITVSDGRISVVSGVDGLHANNDEDSEKGNIEILGGELVIQSGSDGIDASGTVSIQDGVIRINAGSSQNYDAGKGVKADGSITVTGGEVFVSAYDDAIHSNDSVSIENGVLTLSSGDDGIHADNTLTIENGAITVSESYEGLEANDITINGGTISIRASDDGINAAGGNDGSNAFGMFGGDPFGSDSGSTLTINGGVLTVNADGDGLDANGELLVTGGTVYVSGPTNSGNGALDYGTSAAITGGTVIAVGASGMAENFGSGSTQGTILLNLSGTVSAGTAVSIADESGNILASFTPEKSFSSVVISTEGMTVGRTYTVTVGSSSTDITLDSYVYGSGSGMGPGGTGGGPGGGLGGFGGDHGGMGGGPGGGRRP